MKTSRLVMVAITVVVTLGILWMALLNGSLPGIEEQNCDNAWRLSEYKGPRWDSNNTLQVQEVVSTKFGNCELHTVRAEDSQVLDQWLWWNEMDQINTLARFADSGEFYLLRQKRYGYDGESLAPIGGLINPGEKPLEAAKRELLEETGLVADRWVPLGRYRVSVTRGGGFFNCFLALGARHSNVTKPSDDLEAQRPLRVTKKQLREAVLKNRFFEAKWAQCMAISLLWMDNEGIE